MTIEELYELAQKADDGKDARELLSQRHWFASVADFDPKTGEALPQSLDAFLRNVGQAFLPVAPAVVRDRLWRIVDHSRASAERLFRTLNESPRREQALLPVRAVRELNATSFIALSRRHGRNIREKLADKPYLQAVRRFQSIDLPENRLLKAFALRIKELLELRQECLKIEDELLSKIQSWLRTDEAQSIGHWNNLPPNNTLLSHRDYRRVWDAWRWLQSLDDDIKRDRENLNEHRKVVEFWSAIARLKTATNIRFAEIPILFDYEKFTVNSWSTSALRLRTGNQPFAVNFGDSTKHIAATGTRPSIPRVKIETPVCIDLTSLRPCYASLRTVASSREEFNTLPFSFVWQQWKNADKTTDNETTDISLFNADAVWLHPDATTISSPDLFFSKDIQREHLDLAARAFAEKLHEQFTNETLFWLVPDFLNDFELEITRRNLNARFSDAEPLPRSVAAVFEKENYSRIREEIHDGFSVVVQDANGGKICATKLIARFDKELPKRLPETNGFYWERCPPVIWKETPRSPSLAEIPTVDANGNWHDKTPLPKPPFIAPNELRRDERIGQFSFLLNLTESPVCGGIRLHSLQQKAGDIPLWRDQLPELSIEVLSGGAFTNFYLVSRESKHTIIPRRGLKTPIVVEQHFTLPAGVDHYRFPMNQGEGREQLQYDAVLRSPAFPLKNGTECRLELTYEYGADNPYEVWIVPVDKTLFQPIKIAWRPISERPPIDLNKLPIPAFPPAKTWENFRHFPRPKPDRNGKMESDLLEWICLELRKLADIVRFGRVTGVVERWIDKGGDSVFCFVEETLIRKSAFGKSILPAHGDIVSFYKVGSGDGRYKAIDVTNGAQPPSHCFLKNVRFPILTVWNNGHSLSDPKVPSGFRLTVEEGIRNAEILLNDPTIPESLTEELFFFFCCLHKDAPKSVSENLRLGVEDADFIARYERNIAHAIGDASLSWQQQLFDAVVSNTHPSCIKILAISLWRNENLIKHLMPKVVRGLLPVIAKQLNSNKLSSGKDRAKVCTRLELLLALLRTRSSNDIEMKKLLSPASDINRELVDLIDNISKEFMEKGYELHSRIALEFKKPPAFAKTPDLLYALRLYLTGDDGANAIHINSVQDDETDE